MNKYKELFSPHSLRIEVAGSIRRKRPEVGDLELVCIPKFHTDPEDLFEEKTERDPKFVQAVNKLPRLKGNGYGKYVKISIEEHDIHLDLFITTPQQWGVIFMIRTGSAEFSHRMVYQIKPRFKVEDGFLKDEAGKIIPCYQEEDFFNITGMEYLPPEKRER